MKKQAARRFLSDFITFPALIILAGLGGALAVWLFRHGFSMLEMVFLGSDQGLVSAARELPVWRRLLTPVAGAVAGGLILHWFQQTRHACGKHPPTDYIESFTVGKGHLHIAGSLVKCAASLPVVACGLAVGREGAMILLAALAGSAVAYLLPDSGGVDSCATPEQAGRWPGMYGIADDEVVEKRRILVACGAAAGMTAAYHAPIAGIFFVAEVLTGGCLSLHYLGPVALAAFCARLLSGLLGGFSPLYAMPEMPVPDIAIYGVLGVFALLCGVAGAGFLAALDWARAVFAAIAEKVRAPVYARLGAGGLIVGLLSVGVPEVWGNGSSTVEAFLHAPPGAWMVAVILLAKLCAMLASTGAGAPGGVLTPTLFVGAAFGLLLAHAGAWEGTFAAVGWGAPGDWLGAALPLLTLCGMVCILAATTRAPVMSAFMIVEFTGNYDVLPALLFAGFLASSISSRLRPLSVYGLPS